MKSVDVLVLGAGAAGLMCAAEAGKRGRTVLVLDHAEAPGEKIRISGGGRCNFTNLRTSPANFLSENPAFCRSALSRYTAADFVALVERHGIPFHEKTLGQLFCDGSSKAIIDLLLRELAAGGGAVQLGTAIGAIDHRDGGFVVESSAGAISCLSLVVATGGKSIPKMGATGLGYDIAARFGLRVTETRPALVPLTFEADLLGRTSTLAGVTVDGRVSCGKAAFEEAVLFTHRGLSGPAILQISSYWRPGEEIALALAPTVDVFATLRAARAKNGRQSLATALAAILPRRLAQFIAGTPAPAKPIADLSDVRLREMATAINAWRVKPVGSEGYRTAEVTLGGVDTRDLDQRTMAAKAVPGLYFIGEVVDVTGWLGGYNFQWAWSSGWCAGRAA